MKVGHIGGLSLLHGSPFCHMVCSSCACVPYTAIAIKGWRSRGGTVRGFRGNAWETGGGEGRGWFGWRGSERGLGGRNIPQVYVQEIREMLNISWVDGSKARQMLNITPSKRSKSGKC